ncbi:MmcQ/YjbR family DNA-binding protein [Dactylosporangium sp. CA-052675]|uniref:MmcQ/YjbR family DNA-binding protein n=1 Tax=Dactylosporangium sp. CA-052675 TaxID=3239927 RepID=UPI003D924B81
MGLRAVRGVSVDEALRMVLLLPEVDQRQHGNHLGFRIRDKAFAYLCADDLTMLVKATREEQAALVEDDPRAYKKARASGRISWVQVRLRKAHEDELADLITEAWRMTAPRLIVARADLPLC